MKIAIINDDVKSKIIEAAGDAYNRYLLPVAKDCHVDLSAENCTKEDIGYVCAMAGYKPASKDVLTFSGSTLSSASIFLSKDAVSLKERKETLKQRICREIIAEFLKNEDFSDANCLRVMDEIFEIMYFRENVRDFSYGNAQKWVNMAIKFYLIVKAKREYGLDMIRLVEETNLFGYDLFPVDSIMIATIEKDYGIMSARSDVNAPFPAPAPWSSCNSKITFIEYWKFAKKKCDPVKPLIYEMHNWKPKNNP